MVLLKTFSCRIDGAEVAKNGSLLLEGVGHSGLAAPAHRELLQQSQAPCLLHLISEVSEGEGRRRGFGGALPGDDAFDLIDPSKVLQARSRGYRSKEAGLGVVA